MPRFYCAHPLKIGAPLSLPEAVVHHLHVLRALPGHRITLFNGQDGEFAATLVSLEKRQAMANITDHVERDTELPYRLILAQALPEGSKMDWIVEKAVELGASAIQPLAAQRSVVKLTAERAAKRQQHWQGIVIAASEQSGRTRLAELKEVMDLARWGGQPASEPRLLLSPRADLSLASWAAVHPAQDVTVIVGPEGGFNDNEENLLKSQGAVAVSMGPRILRTETAGMTALAIINAAWDQM